MQAIIMAAGKGSRLGNLTENKPKAFLEIQGIKLIEYNLAMLHAYGVEDILIVTGYLNEYYEQLCSELKGIRCVYNPFYEMMNVLGSFFIGQEYLKEEDTIYMHADTLCAPEIFEDMLIQEADIVLPVDYKICDEEAMKVRCEGSKVAAISKEIPCELAQGEFIGIAKIGRNTLENIKNASKALMKEKQFASYFEGAIQYLIDQGGTEIVTVPTNGRFWGEVDFLEDYRKVEYEISPKLVQIARKFLS